MKLGDKVTVTLEVHEIRTKKNGETIIGIGVPNSKNSECMVYIYICSVKYCPESKFTTEEVRKVEHAQGVIPEKA